MQFFLKHIELILSAAGLLVIGLVPRIFRQEARWQVTSLTAIGVGLLHGTIFWVIRQRQRTVRQQAIDEVSRMLEDVVNNQLAVILMTVYDTQAERQQELIQVQSAMHKITDALNSLSEESLQDWHTKYQHIASASQRG